MRGSGIDDYGEECGTCEGEGVIEINQYYENFIALIETTLSDDNREILTVCEQVREIILAANEESGDYFFPTNRNVYDRLIDLVAEWTIKNENNETLIPEDYENDKS